MHSKGIKENIKSNSSIYGSKPPNMETHINKYIVYNDKTNLKFNNGIMTIKYSNWNNKIVEPMK